MYNRVLVQGHVVSDQVWTPLVVVHVSSAMTAMGLGAVVLARRRRGDRSHRRLGSIWAAAMYATVVTSFRLRMITPGSLSWLHLLSAWTAVSVTTAVWAARTGRRRLHAAHMVGSFTGLVIAGMAAAVAPGRLIPKLVLEQPATAAAGLATLLALTGLACAAATRHPRRPSPSRFPS